MKNICGVNPNKLSVNIFTDRIYAKSQIFYELAKERYDYKIYDPKLNRWIIRLNILLFNSNRKITRWAAMINIEDLLSLSIQNKFTNR